MSKNLTRKGLALGAVVALGTSLFAGAPAQAAAAINIAPSAGTGYTVLGSDTFTLKAFGTAEYSIAASTNLRWKITKPAANSVVEIKDQAGSTGATTADTSRADIVYYTPSTVSATLGANTITLNPTVSTAADVTYKVQAYIESDTTLGLGATETASAEQTVTFSATAVPTIVLDPIVKNVAVTGKVTYAVSGFNYDQTTTTATRVVFTQNGVEKTATTTASREETYLAVTATGISLTVADNDVISAVAQAIRYDGDTTYGASAASGVSTGASTADAKSNTVTSGANLTLGSAGNYLVREGTKQVVYTTQFKKGTTAVAAGQPVTITIQENASYGLDGSDVVKVNGTTVPNGTAGASNRGASKVINTTTGTDGKVTITIDNTFATAGDWIDVAVTSGGASSNTLTFKWVEAELKAMKEASAPLRDGAPDAVTRTIVRNTAFSTTYHLLDQFGEKWTTANTGTAYRLKAYIKSTDTGAATWTEQLANFTAGVATLSFTDNSTANTGYRVSLDVWRQQGGSGDWVTGSNDDDVTSTELWFKPVSAAAAATKITLKEALFGALVASKADGTASDEVSRSTSTLTRLDRRAGEYFSTTGITLYGVAAVKVTGVVTRADGSVAAGSEVTLKSPGVFFSTNSSVDTYGVADAITVLADESGIYTAYVLSNSGGTKTITTTAGTATAVTQKIKFAAAAPSSGSVITITAPSYSAAGRSVDVVVALTDKFGAAVQSSSASPLRVTVTGAGSYTTIAADSDADGLVSFKLIFGANETGVATIKATYDAENDATIDITKTATVTIGSAPVAGAKANVVGKTKAFSVSVSGNASAKNVVVKVAGKTVATLKGSKSAKTYTVKATKGSKKVTVYVGGKLLLSKTVSVK